MSKDHIWQFLVSHKDHAMQLGAAIFASIWGSAAAAFMSHEGDGLNWWGFTLLILRKTFVGSFAGFMACMVALSLHWDIIGSSILAGVAGVAAKEFLDVLVKKYKARIES